MADSRIKSVSELLSSFFDRDLVKKGECYAGLDRSWKSIAGARLGEHSKPTDIRHNILIVEAEHQGWMQLLQLQQDRMLGDIQRRFPDLEIRGIAWRLASEPVSESASRRAFKPGEAEAPAPVGARAESQHPGPEDRARPVETSQPAENREASGLPPELRAKFARIKKNIGK